MGLMSELARSDLFDKEDPRSLYNLLPEGILRRVSEVPTELLTMSEAELTDLTPRRRFTVVDHRLKHTFWKEYERAAAHMVPMNIANVIAGVCNKATFTTGVLGDPVRVAFMLQPPVDYKVALEETLTTLVDKLRQVADLPVHDEDGAPNYKNIELILKAFPHIDNRVKGGATQRIESKSLTVSVKESDAVPVTVDEIDERLKQLESKVVAGPKVVEVKGVEIGAITVSLDDEGKE